MCNFILKIKGATRRQAAREIARLCYVQHPSEPYRRLDALWKTVVPVGWDPYRVSVFSILADLGGNELADTNQAALSISGEVRGASMRKSAQG